MSKLKINKEFCKSCKLCVIFCPHGILEIGDEINTSGYRPIKIIDEDRCNSCGTCALVCPEVCIEVFVEK